MKRYWFELTDEHYNDLGAAISDGWQKSPAIAEAKRRYRFPQRSGKAGR